MSTTAKSPPRRSARAESWVPRISAAWRQSVEAIVECGRRLIAARAALSKGEWVRMFSDHPSRCSHPLPFSRRTAAMLVAIAEHPVLAAAHHGARLPASWRTLYELSRFEPEQLTAAIEAGKVTTETTRAQAVALYVPPHRKWELTLTPEQLVRLKVEKAIGRMEEAFWFSWVRADLAGDTQYVAHAVRHLTDLSESACRMLAEHEGFGRLVLDAYQRLGRWPEW